MSSETQKEKETINQLLSEGGERGSKQKKSQSGLTRVMEQILRDSFLVCAPMRSRFINVTEQPTKNPKEDTLGQRPLAL